MRDRTKKIFGCFSIFACVFLLCNGANAQHRCVSQKEARATMGENYFGIEEAVNAFGIKPTPAQLSALSEVPFTEIELRERRQTHILVAVFPLSIIEIRDKVAHSLFFDPRWYEKESFAALRGDASWQLIRKMPVPNSTNKNWREQQMLLEQNEEVPTARVMVYAIIGHYLHTGERLLGNTYNRCSDLDSRGDRVRVGDFVAPFGLRIGHNCDGCGESRLGVSSFLKPSQGMPGKS